MNPQPVTIRPIDELGRISIPKELRAELGWNDRDEIAFYKTEDNAIILRRKETN